MFWNPKIALHNVSMHLATCIFFGGKAQPNLNNWNVLHYPIVPFVGLNRKIITYIFPKKNKNQISKHLEMICILNEQIEWETYGPKGVIKMNCKKIQPQRQSTSGVPP
jgi:hypothetical protein